MHKTINSKESGVRMKKNNFRTFLAGLVLAISALTFLPATSAVAAPVCDAGLKADPDTGLCIKPTSGAGFLGATSLTGLILKIINLLLGVAAIIAVFFIVVGGYRYIFSNGNDEQAQAGRKTLTNAVIGLVIIILAYAIVTIVNNTVAGGSTFIFG